MDVLRCSCWQQPRLTCRSWSSWWRWQEQGRDYQEHWKWWWILNKSISFNCTWWEKYIWPPRDKQEQIHRLFPSPWGCPSTWESSSGQGWATWWRLVLSSINNIDWLMILIDNGTMIYCDQWSPVLRVWEADLQQQNWALQRDEMTCSAHLAHHQVWLWRLLLENTFSQRLILRIGS